jgi:hypothetical protein
MSDSTFKATRAALIALEAAAGVSHTIRTKQHQHQQQYSGHHKGLRSSDQRVTDAAAWVLAAAAATARASHDATVATATAGGVEGEGRSGSSSSRSNGSGVQVPLLQAYPADGVLRPLAEKLLQPGMTGVGAATSQCLTTAVLRCEWNARRM